MSSLAPDEITGYASEDSNKSCISATFPGRCIAGDQDIDEAVSELGDLIRWIIRAYRECPSEAMARLSTMFRDAWFDVQVMSQEAQGGLVVGPLMPSEAELHCAFTRAFDRSSQTAP